MWNAVYMQLLATLGRKGFLTITGSTWFQSALSAWAKEELSVAREFESSFQWFPTCKPCPKSHLIGPLYSVVDCLTKLLLRKSNSKWALSAMAQMPSITSRPASFCKACLIFVELVGSWAANSSKTRYAFQPGSDLLSQYQLVEP